MGTRILGPCSIRACPNRSAGHGLCIAHEQQRKARLDAERAGSSLVRQIHSAEWRQARAEQLRREPYCRHCGADATEVHHIIRRANGGTDEPSNLMSLCRRCHSSITSKEVR